MNAETFPGRLGVIQRVLPAYRAPFFDALARACEDGLGLFAGQPRPIESIATTTQLQSAVFAPARNLHLFPRLFYLCYQRGLLPWLADWNPDALIVEANPRYVSTPAAVNWMKRRGRPVIGWGLGVTAPGGGRFAGIRNASRLRFLRQFDALIAYSQRGAEQYAAAGFAPDQIFVAPNAVAPRPAHTMPQRPEPGPGSPLTVLYVGRLQARKRLDNLLHACASLPTGLQPRLVIVGDGPERDALTALAAQVYPQAAFPGAKHGAELAPYFETADLFALPGTGGLAVQEAMSYGLPVIVAKGDGTQDDLVRPGNGWQIPPDDLPALQSTLAGALADPFQLRRMGAESYRIVAEEINLERMVAGFVRALGVLGWRGRV